MKQQTTTFRVYVKQVKQSGVLPTIFYGIYNDSLLTMLTVSDIVCYLGCTFCGSSSVCRLCCFIVSYWSGLSKMLNICKQLSCIYDIVFNSGTTTYCILYPYNAELFYENLGDQRVFSLWNHHKCLSQLFPINLNTYVMGLRPLEIFVFL